ncbi:MAG: hypothetical protein COB48_06435 [Pseudoalteromonas sp.]|nr:MAG: hypothetical protein COB48_06435 [Pseudoalteromonas sp.]
MSCWQAVFLRYEAGLKRLLGSRFELRGSRFKVQGSRFKVQGSRFKVQGSRFKVQGSRHQKNIKTPRLIQMRCFFIPVAAGSPRVGIRI